MVVDDWQSPVPQHLAEWKHILIGHVLGTDVWHAGFIPLIWQLMSQAETGDTLQSSSTISSPVISPFHDIKRFYQYS